MSVIGDIRNYIVANMSKVYKEDYKGQKGLRAIKNGKTSYLVLKEEFDTFEDYGCPREKEVSANSKVVAYTVADRNAQRRITIVKRDNICGELPLDKCEIFMGDLYQIGGLKLSDDTDINNINDVRYQLEKMNSSNAKEFAYFIDKFVIVTPEEREAYKNYKDKIYNDAENERIKREEQIKEARSLYRQKKVAEKAAEKEEKKLAKEQYKVNKRFFGGR